MNWYKRVLAGGLPVYSYRNLIKKLQKEYGLKYLRPGKGDDQIWGDPEKGISATIPYRSGTTDINPDTMKDILRNLGIPVSNFSKKQRKKEKRPDISQIFLNNAEPAEPISEKQVKDESYKNQPWWIEQQRKLGLQ